MISIKCQACGMEMRVKEEHAGKKTKCKYCQELIHIPAPVIAAIVAPLAPPPPAAIKPPAVPKATAVVSSKPRPVKVNQKLMQCPACDDTVSKKAMRCPHCGHKLKTPQRGFFGVIFKWLFILFNLLMAYSIFQGCQAANKVILETEDRAGAAGATVGAGLAIGILIFIWLAGDVILGLFVLLSRPRE